MIKAKYQKHILEFKRPSGTSRGVLKTKETWFLMLYRGSKWGIGECGILRGLSVDDVPSYEEKLAWTCKNINLDKETLLYELRDFPSIQMGVETAFLSLESNTNPFKLYPSKFTESKDAIAINGLIWMGSDAFMKEQIAEKLNEGFHCIKMKIGAIDFDTEFKLLQSIRKSFSPEEIELRVDANGAFTPKEAMGKLEQLAHLDLHSIEQPIKQGQWQEIARLCEDTPLPIALDEELIGVIDPDKQKSLIETIKPQYIILKPSLVGGFSGSDHWIELAENENADWWITSALESNIGLNAIAQYTYIKNNPLPQGLGTGSLYTNNIPSPLEVEKGKLHYAKSGDWKLEDSINLAK